MFLILLCYGYFYTHVLSQDNNAIVSLSHELREEHPQGFEVLNVASELKLTGITFGSSKTILFELTKVDDFGYFTLDKNGHLYIKDRIDRESICPGNQEACQIKILGSVREQDGSIDQTMKRFRVTFNILDINDNRPMCSKINSRIEINEDLPVGKSILKWKLTDIDSQPFSITSVRLEPNNSPFKLNLRPGLDEGSLNEVIAEVNVAQSLLDLEKRYDLRLTLSDSYYPKDDASPTLTNCSFSVVVNDINNNEPKWENPIEFFNFHILKMEFYENQLNQSKRIIQFKATDRDHNANARVIYELVGADDLPLQKDDAINKHFYLDPITGWLSSKSNIIDFESFSKDYRQYNPGEIVLNLNISARDDPEDTLKRKFAPIGKMIIKIFDTNDNHPVIRIISQFNSRRMSHNNFYDYPIVINGIVNEVIEVPENIRIGSSIATILVTDEDSEAFGSVHCKLYDTNESLAASSPLKNAGLSRYFKLINNDNLVTLTEIDRENVSVYWLSLVCSDNDKRAQTYPQKSIVNDVKVLIKLNVLDVNDNRPEFDFSDSLDRHLFVFEVPENPKRGSHVAQLKFHDNDSPERSVHLWGMQTGHNSIIELDEKTGVVRIAEKDQEFINSYMDREIRDKIDFNVYLEDYAQGSEEYTYKINTTLILIIKDLNDNGPTGKQTIEMSILENSEPGTSIGYISARDSDEPNTPNSALTFKIVHFDNSEMAPEFDMSNYSHDCLTKPFRIKSRKSVKNLDEIELDPLTGELRVGKLARLDREKERFYRILVEISDGYSPNKTQVLPQSQRKCAYFTVRLNIIDINDHEPVFKYPEDGRATLTFSCGDIHNVPLIIAKINATDRDEDYGYVSYSIDPHSMDQMFENNNRSIDSIQNFFTIDPTNGELTMVHLDEEKISRFCDGTEKKNRELLQIIKVTATDNGLPRKFSQATITIKFIDSSIPQITDPKRVSEKKSMTPSKDERLLSLLDPSSKETPKMFWIAAICLGVATLILLILILGVCYLTVKQKHSTFYQSSNERQHQDIQTSHFSASLGPYLKASQPHVSFHQTQQKLQTTTYNQLYPTVTSIASQKAPGYLTKINNFVVSPSDENQRNAYQTLQKLTNNPPESYHLTPVTGTSNSLVVQLQANNLASAQYAPLHTFKEQHLGPTNPTKEFYSDSEDKLNPRDHHQANNNSFIRLERNESSFV